MKRFLFSLCLFLGACGMNSKTEQTQGGKGPKEVIHQDEEMRCQVQFKESESRREIGAKANLMRIQCGLSEEEVLALIK